MYKKATTKAERAEINRFLEIHNGFDAGSKTGYIAYYAAIDGQTLVAAAKICPLHTPAAARFFGGDDWRHVYSLQRLAAYGMPEGKLSEFVGWFLRDIGRDPKVWYVATYADTGKVNSTTGIPHVGTIYRATNAIYAGMSRPTKKVIGYRMPGDGMFHSMRNGGRTLRLDDLPEGAVPEYATMKHRWAWPVGPPLKRAFRRAYLEERFKKYRFEAIYQPRLLIRRLLYDIIVSRLNSTYRHQQAY